ncbi:hypothetical protein D3C72_500300 [compost metagenome]
MTEEGAAQTRKISRLIDAAAQHRIPILCVEQVNGAGIRRVILLTACGKLCWCIVDTERMQHFFDKRSLKAC